MGWGWVLGAGEGREGALWGGGKKGVAEGGGGGGWGSEREGEGG